MNTLQALALAHWHALMLALGVWIAVATFLARKWPKPAAAAKWYVKLGHFLLVDLPALAATLEGKTWAGTTVSIPFITWTVRQNGDSGAGGASKAAALLPLLLLPLLLNGCAPTQAYIGALKFTTGASTVLVDASDVWHRFDQVHQQAIVDGATSLATGQQELASWRAERNRVDDAFVAARKAVATLADALNAAGAAQKNDYGTALADVVAAVGQLTSLLAQYNVKIPGLPAVLELRHIAPPFMVAAIIAGQEQCADSMPRISYGGRWLCIAPMFAGGVR